MKLATFECEMRESTDKELVIAGFVAVFLLIVCLGISQVLLPGNCYLFDNRQHHFLCDGIDMENPTPCPTCQDTRMSYVAHVVFLFGGFAFLLPFIVIWIRNRRTREDDFDSIVANGDKH